MSETTETSLELWLVRHGETPRSKARLLAGWDDIPLTEEGKEQARLLRPRLSDVAFESAWSSDLTRTCQTAREAIAREVRMDARLREINFGQLDGLGWDDLNEAYRASLLAFDGFEAPGGESLVVFEQRLMAFIDDLTPGRHLIFTHGGVIRALCRRFGYMAFAPPASLTIVDWSGGRVVEPDAALATQADRQTK